MNTIPLRRPWWLRIEWPWRHHRVEQASQLPRDHDELMELDARTLRDIGAPDELLARAHARREAQLLEHDGLRTGIAAGAWRHW